jgi:teichuronic acid biosynthesis glycosyltransferase TuaH
MLAAPLTRLSTWGPPGGYRPGLRALRQFSLRAQGRHAARSRVDFVVATSLDNVLTATPGATRLLIGTDDYVAGAELMGQPTRRLVRDEARQLERADLVTAVSGPLALRWSRILGRNVDELPNGCDADHYQDVESAALPPGVLLPPPVVGLFGTISERIDIALLEALVQGGLSLLIVGPRRPSFEPSRFSRLVSLPAVHWAGPQPYDRLPGYMRLVDVGITPYVDSPFNRASFPLKTLEYLAAGRPVVSTPLPAVRSLATDLVSTAATPHDFVTAVRIAATLSRRQGLPEERRHFARQHSWPARARQLLALAAGARRTPS